MAINDNKTTVLTAILLAQTKDELMEIGEFFGVMLRQADWKAAMVLGNNMEARENLGISGSFS